LITSGCQQSLDLICRLFLSGGDSSVAVENPTYPAAVQLFRLWGSKLIGMPVPENDERLEDVGRIVHSRNPSLLYVVPNYQNPTGTILSRDARVGLVDIVVQNGTRLVEDDVFGDLYFEGLRPPSVSAFDRNESVIYVSSVSKTLSMGLRVGWVVASARIVQQLAEIKQLVDLRTNGLLQAATDLFIRRGIYERHLGRMRRLFRQRRDVVLECLWKYFPRTCSWSEPKGGLSIWVTVDEELDTRSLLVEAESVGVAFSSGDLFYVDSSTKNQLRLGYGLLENPEIREGIRLLGKILHSKHFRRKSA
jgi:2-aminoadipate transaminase